MAWQYFFEKQLSYLFHVKILETGSNRGHAYRLITWCPVLLYSPWISLFPGASIPSLWLRKQQQG